MESCDVTGVLKAMVTISSHHVSAVVDSGASHCMISATLANKLGLLKYMKPCTKIFRSANGNRSKPLGIIHNQSISLGSTTIPVNIFVSSAKNYLILLGNTFLTPTKIIIDYAESCIKCFKVDAVKIISMDFQNSGKESHSWCTEVIYPIKNNPNI